MPDVARAIAQLELVDLAYSYGERPAIDGVSLRIERGEIFGLLGPNGAGKTTTISCIAGLRRPSRGSMSFDGRAYAPASDDSHRARIGIVPQDLAIYGELSARENLEFFGRLHGLEGGALAAAVGRALQLAGLAERAGDRVDSFSGGMKRRLNLAAGDLHAPDLLLLDEPTAGVDPQSRNHLFDALDQLRRSGRTLLLTTHYMEEAERMCDRIAILDVGRVIAAGTQAEIAQSAGLPGADLEQVFLKLTGRRLRDE
jgi:ABC-2 type transport system ATP-binding protein